MADERTPERSALDRVTNAYRRIAAKHQPESASQEERRERQQDGAERPTPPAAGRNR